MSLASIATAASLQDELLPCLPGPGTPIAIHLGGSRSGRSPNTKGLPPKVTGAVEDVLPWGLLVRTVGGWRTCFSLTDFLAGHVVVDEPGPTRRAVERVRGVLSFATALPPLVPAPAAPARWAGPLAANAD